MFTGTLALDLLLGDVHSLKEKRGVVRPIVAELRRRFEVSAAEAGHLDLHRRALIGVAVVAADRAHCVEVLDACERLVAGRPEIELLSARRTYARAMHSTTEDDDGGAAVSNDARARKLADRIRVIVAETLETRVKDPRLGFVTITDTRITGDLREATVFYTVYGTDEERAGTAAALESRQGHPALRGRPADRAYATRRASSSSPTPSPRRRRTSRTCCTWPARPTPRCTRSRRRRRYAGEPDPYRVPHVDDEDDEDRAPSRAA